MNRRFCMTTMLMGVLALTPGLTRAQQAPSLPPPEALLHAGPGGEMAPPMGEPVELLGFEGMHGGKVVTGVPFSAMVTTTQTLADGNHISRTSYLYRDRQGRFRREVMLPGGTQSFVVISDPVAGNQYLLRPDQKVAYTMPGRGMKGLAPTAGKGLGNREWKGHAEANVQQEAITTPPSVNLGANVEGTRYTRTIHKGEIGNEKDINVVSERWYSKDLQIVVMSTRSDPRFGSTTYVVSNIQQQDPPKEMFTVPADYTMKEGRPWGMRRFRGGPSAAAPATPPPTN